MGGLLEHLEEASWWEPAAAVIEQHVLAVYGANRSILRRGPDGNISALLRPRMVASLARHRGQAHQLKTWLNKNLSHAVRKLVGEAQRNGIIDAEEAANLAGVPNLSQKGTRLGNWLTRDQAKELLTVPRSKGSETMRSWPYCWAAPCGGRSSPAWTLAISSSVRGDGWWPICAARAAECERWRFRYGLRKQSTPGW
jgi:hypothetical protein